MNGFCVILRVRSGYEKMSDGDMSRRVEGVRKE
jgi:hypothetical protein